MEKNYLNFGVRLNRLIVLWICVFFIILLCVDYSSTNHLSSVRGSRRNSRQNLGISNQRRTTLSRNLNQRQILRSNTQRRSRTGRRRLSQNCIPGSICRSTTTSRRRTVQNPRRLSDVRRIVAGRRRPSSSSQRQSGLNVQAQMGNIRGRLSLGGQRRVSRIQNGNSLRQRARNRLLRQNTGTSSRRQNGRTETQNRVAAVPRQEVDSRLNALETISSVLPSALGNLINSLRSSGGTPAIGLGIGIGSSSKMAREPERTIPQQPQRSVPNTSNQVSLQQSMDKIRQSFIRSRLENTGNRNSQKQTFHPLQSQNSIIQTPEAQPLPPPPPVVNQPQSNAISPNAITFQAPALDQGQFTLDQNTGQFSQQGGMQQLSIDTNNQNGMAPPSTGLNNNINTNTNGIVRNLNNQGLVDNGNTNVIQPQTQILNRNFNANVNPVGPRPVGRNAMGTGQMLGLNNQLSLGFNAQNNIVGGQNINLQSMNLQNNLLPGTQFMGVQEAGPIPQNAQNQIIGLQSNFNQNVGPLGPDQKSTFGIQNNNQLIPGQVMGANNLMSGQASQFVSANTPLNTSGGQMMPNNNNQVIQGQGQTFNVPIMQEPIPNSNVQVLQNQNTNINTQGQAPVGNVPGIPMSGNNQVFQGQMPVSNMQGTQNLIQTPTIQSQNQNVMEFPGQNPSTGFQGMQNNQMMQNQMAFANVPTAQGQGQIPISSSNGQTVNAQIQNSNILGMPNQNSNIQAMNNQVQNVIPNSFGQGNQIFNNGNRMLTQTVQGQNQFMGNAQMMNSNMPGQMQTNQITFPEQPTVIVGKGPSTAGLLGPQVPFANQLGPFPQLNGAPLNSLGTLQSVNGGFQNIPTLMPNAQFAPVTTKSPPSTTPKRVVIAVDPKSKGIKIVPDGNGGVKVIHLRHAITATPWNETTGIEATTAMPMAPDTLVRPDIKNISDPELLRKLERTDRINTTDIPEELEINGTSYDGTYHNPIMPSSSARKENHQVVPHNPPNLQMNPSVHAHDPELLRKLERTDRINTTDIPEELEINGTSYDGTYHNPIMPSSSARKENHQVVPHNPPNPQMNPSVYAHDPELLRKLERTDRINTTDIPEELEINGTSYDGTYHNPIMPSSSARKEHHQVAPQEPPSQETTTASSVEVEATTLMEEEEIELELEEMTSTETTTTEVTTTEIKTTTVPPVTDIAVNKLNSAKADNVKTDNSFTIVKKTLSSSSQHKLPEQNKVNLKEHLIKIMRNSQGKPGIELKIISLPKRDTKHILDYRPR